MDLFTVIDDAFGILKLPKGIQKQVKLYSRKDRVYAPMSGGYIEVRARDYDIEGAYDTSHPDVKVLELELASFHHVKELGRDRLRFGKGPAN